MKDLQQVPCEGIKALRYFFFHPDATRLELIKHLQVSHLTAGNVIRDLEKLRYIYKSGKIQGESGRPSTTYRITADLASSLGMHIDLDTVRFVLINANAEKLMQWESDSMPNQSRISGCQGYIDHIEKLIIEGLRKVADEGYSEPVSIGITLPGMVDSENGIWISGLQLQGIRNIPLQEELEKRLNIPLFIEDNARSLIILEKVHGAAREHNNAVLLYLGAGMGTGIVIGDQVYRGVHGTAGEIGHIPHGNSTYRCSCGNIGCFETIVSPYGILRIFTDRLFEGVSSLLQQHRDGNSYNITLENILDAAQKGDHLTIKTLAEIGEYIGDACDILIKLFNPEVLIITGFSSIFSSYLRANVENTISLKIAPEISRDFKIHFSEYQPHFEAWGAAMVAWNELIKSEIRNRK